MKKLENYALGSWLTGEGDGSPLYNSVTGNIVAMSTTKGLDFEKILNYGRKTGGTPLRKMTFQERGNMLKKLALYLTERKEQFYEVSYMTGATRADSWADIEVVLEIYLRTHPCGEILPIKVFMLMVTLWIFREEEVLPRSTLWCRSEESPFISMHIIFQFGGC
jgi:hypothetical protein